jgi:hypothetical protein
VLHRASWISAALRFPLVVWLGRRSYAFYLWHYPIILLLHRQPKLTHWEIAAIALPLTLAIAAVLAPSGSSVPAPEGSVRVLAGRRLPCSGSTASWRRKCNSHHFWTWCSDFLTVIPQTLSLVVATCRAE